MASRGTGQQAPHAEVHLRDKPKETGSRASSLVLIVFLVALIVAGLLVFCELVYRPPAPFECDTSDRDTEKVWPLYAIVAGADRDVLREADEPPREAILLMHGVHGSSAVWQHALEVGWPEEDRERYQIVIPDLLGHGNSPKPQNIAYTVKQHVDSVIDVLDRLVPEGRPLHIVGSSLSGPLAVAIASRLLRTGDRRWPLLTVTLIVPAYFPGTDRDRIVGLLRNSKRYLKLENTFYLFSRYLMSPLRFLLLPLARHAYTNAMPESAHRDRVALHGFKADAYAVRSSIEALVVRYDIDAGLKTLCEANIPVLFMDASDDWIKQHDPARESLKIKEYSCVRYSVVNGKHKVFLSDPQTIFSLLREFIDQQQKSV